MDTFLLDVTRTISRIGQGKPTGVDRVELQYLRVLAQNNHNCLTVAKIGSEFVVCSSRTIIEMLDKIAVGQSIGRMGLPDMFRFKLGAMQRRARTFLRKNSISCSADARSALALPMIKGCEYVNVGHSNLSGGFLQAVRVAGCSKISVLVHDLIPLDYPQFTRAKKPQQFAKKMRAVAQHSDRVICNSAYTQARVQAQFGLWGRVPETIVAHLGVDLASTTVQHSPKRPPYFVVLSTIEPRKNHQLLIDVWASMAQQYPEHEIPMLHIVGRRGWDNAPVFRFLDNSPLMGIIIHEHNDLGDGALVDLIAGAVGLLFPSFAEGFGLPALEAAQIGVPVLCSDLPVFREILGDYAHYLDPTQPELWARQILSDAKKPGRGSANTTNAAKKVDIPSWESHFGHVFGFTGDSNRLTSSENK